MIHPQSYPGTPARYSWIAVMGAEYVEVDVIERDEHVLVTGPTRDRMVATAVTSGILADDEAVEQARAMMSLAGAAYDPRTDGDLFDVTDFFGGWEQAQAMRVDPEPTPDPDGYVDGAGYDLTWGEALGTDEGPAYFGSAD